MNIDEVVAIWKSRGLIADKMSTLTAIQENLREGLRLDLYRSNSPVPDTIWVRVCEPISAVTISEDTVQLRYIDNESFKDYFKPKLKFSLRLTGPCALDMATDSKNEALRLLDSTAWDRARLVIRRDSSPGGDFPGATFSQDDMVLIHGPDGYKIDISCSALKRIINYLHDQVKFSFEVNPTLENNITPQ